MTVFFYVLFFIPLNKSSLITIIIQKNSNHFQMNEYYLLKIFYF